MPELGESVTEGTVTRWLKKVGDAVDVDEPLVEVSTDKVDTEIPSPVAGTLISITAEEDVTVAVGGELARIGSGAATATPKPAPEPQARPARQPEAAARTATGACGETRAAAATRTGTHAASHTRARTTSRRPSPRRQPVRRALRTSLRWCESSPPRTTLTSASSTEPGWVDASANRMCCRPLSRRKKQRRRRRRAPRRRRGPVRPEAERAGAGSRVGPSARNHAEGQSHPPDHRQQDPGIAASHRAAHPDPRGRHDPDRCTAGEGQSRVRGTRRREPDLPAVHRARRDRCAQDPPEHQRQLQRRHQGDHLLRRRAPRLRRRHRAGPALPRRPQRR